MILDPGCHCDGQSAQDIYHVLFKCPLFLDLRRKWSSSMCSGVCNMDCVRQVMKDEESLRRLARFLNDIVVRVKDINEAQLRTS